MVKTSSRLVKHARYHGLLLGEVHLTRKVFGGRLRGIAPLPLESVERVGEG